MLKRKLRNKKLYFKLLMIYDVFRDFIHSKVLSREQVVRRRYKKRQNKKMDLNNPTEFNDKIQWLKFNWYDAYAIQCADKYKVRNIIKKEIGEKYLNKLIAVYDDVSQIDIGKLPKSFVLKGTHGSGFNIVCKDKTKINWDLKKVEMKRWLKTKYYLKNGEWVYEGIKPRIICEVFMEDDSQKQGLTDYKFYCFHGEPKYCQVIQDRFNGGTIDFYDINWNHMEFTGLQDLPRSNKSMEKPEKYEEMIRIARKLASRFPFVRIDFYYVNNRIYFGEFTFFPRSGFGSFKPAKWNEKIGNLLDLEEISKENKQISK